MREERRSSRRGTSHRTGRPVPGARDRRPDGAAEGPTDVFRKAVALHPFIDDDWPECRRALPSMKDEHVVVAWLLRWGRSQDQIAEITGFGLTTVKYFAAYVRDRLEVRSCRDIGPKTAHLLNLLRVAEGRLTLDARPPPPTADGRAAGGPPAGSETGRRPGRKGRPGRDGGARSPPPG